MEIISIENLKLLAKKSKELGYKYGVKGLIKYSELLDESINNFNLVYVKKLLNHFDKIIRIIYGK